MQFIGLLWCVLFVPVAVARDDKDDAIAELESLIDHYKDESYQSENKKETSPNNKGKATITAGSIDGEIMWKKPNTRESSMLSLDVLLKAYNGLTRVSKQNTKLANVHAGNKSKKLSKDEKTEIVKFLRNTLQRELVKIDENTKLEPAPPENKIEYVVDNAGRECGLDCRLSYRKCLITTKYLDNFKCAQQFVRTYPGCFFHNVTQEVQNDQYLCYSSCLSHFDQCLFFSSKPESMVCLRARKHCSSKCPAAKGRRVKRDCYGVCAGYFVICEQVVEQYEDLYICKENEMACRKACDEE